MRLRFAPQALRNIHEIADYLHSHSPTGSRHVSEAFEDSFTIIAEFPRAGRLFKKGLRRLVVTRYPYLIYYRVHEKADVAEIVAIRHAAQSNNLW